ncbi:MAG: MBL fold metallo-hydrolase [Neptuniibacter sp.]
MKRTSNLIASLVLGAVAVNAGAQTLQSAEYHRALGLKAAEHAPGYANLCDLESRIRNVNVPRTLSRNAKAKKPESGTGKRKRAKASPLPPTQVFDNLYYFGTSSVGAWLYGNENGYILIDGLNTDEEAAKYIIEGMNTLGLKPEAIKHIVVTHAHGDHYGGADYIAEKLSLEILMSEPDWKLARFLGNHPRFGPPPQMGRVVTDGEILTVGEMEMALHITPGHTPGTLSPVFRVYDNGEPHMAMLWGGTGFNFGPNKGIFLNYADSAAKMRNISALAGVDVFLSGHPKRDGSDQLIAELGNRITGQPHPFVKDETGHELFTVLEQCALAQAARFSESK